MGLLFNRLVVVRLVRDFNPSLNHRPGNTKCESGTEQQPRHHPSRKENPAIWWPILKPEDNGDPHADCSRQPMQKHHQGKSLDLPLHSRHISTPLLCHYAPTESVPQLPRQSPRRKSSAPATRSSTGTDFPIQETRQQNWPNHFQRTQPQPARRSPPAPNTPPKEISPPATSLWHVLRRRSTIGEPLENNHPEA